MTIEVRKLALVADLILPDRLFLVVRLPKAQFVDIGKMFTNGRTIWSNKR